MTFRKLLCTILLILLACGIFFAGWYLLKDLDTEEIMANIAAQTSNKSTTEADEDATEEAPTEVIASATQPESITMAIYPYVSDPELFQNVLTEMWEEMETGVALKFMDWNCFSDPDPRNIDVITYNALFMEYLAEYGYIQPLDMDFLDSTASIIPFAMEGSYYNGKLYALPFQVSSYFLIHFADDEAMDKVNNFAELYEELSSRVEEDSSDGLQIGYYDELPYFYLDALTDYNGTYTTFEEIPEMDPLDENVMARLNEIQSIMAEINEGEYYLTNFTQWQGSACYTFNEDLYYMDDFVEDLTIRPISFFNGKNIQLFYGDFASLSTQVTDPVQKEYCMKLINLIASEEFQAHLCYGSGKLQYILPTRELVYLTASEEYPIYKTLYALATNGDNQIFRFGTQVYDYMDTAYEYLS